MSIRRQEALDYHAQGRPGKIQVSPTKPFKNQRDPSLAYTPANTSYKLLSRVGGAEAIGPILVGMAQPVRVLQRGSDVNDIVNMAVIAAVDAQEHGRRPRA